MLINYTLGKLRFISNLSRSFHSLPVINIQSFINGSKNFDSLIKQVDKTCREVGFFYLTGHGVSQSLVEDSISIAREYFNLPLEEKNKISILNSKTYRGYQILGQNITQAKRDWHEGIDMFSEEGVSVPYQYDPSKPIHGPNQWPEYPTKFRPIFEQYIQEMQKLGEQIMKLIALALDQEIDFFSKYTNKGYWGIRIISYPPLPSNKSDDVGDGTGIHSDYGCLTIVNQNNATFGLQVQNTQGEWITANPIPGTFVINLGDMLAIWTGGVYKSTPHRVIHNRSNDTRISIPFFYEPNYDAVIKPLKPVEGYPSAGVMYGDHVISKVTNNFDFKVV